MTKAPISFLVETPLGNPGKDLGAHTARDKALICRLTVGWVPRRPPWGYREDRGNTESQQRASSHGLENNRNGIINTVTNPQAPLSTRWQNCALQPGPLGGTCQASLACCHTAGLPGLSRGAEAQPCCVGHPAGCREAQIACGCAQTDPEGHKSPVIKHPCANRMTLYLPSTLPRAQTSIRETRTADLNTFEQMGTAQTGETGIEKQTVPLVR